MLGIFDRRAARGQKALRQRRLDEAERVLLELTAEGSTRPDVWWNLGLVYKFQRRWPEALATFRRYVELAPQPEGFWNAGVVATALRDWPTARWAWRRLDFTVGGADGPPEVDFGLGPVRLDPDRSGEVVWGRRIDPCRMRIESVPMPESGHRWHDIVLHDVVPNGSRRLGDQELPVFDELERMEPAPDATNVAELSWDTPDDEQQLADLLQKRGLAGENWTSSVQFICRACSVADTHAHDKERPTEIRRTGTWGFGGPADSIAEALREWSAAGQNRSVATLQQAESLPR